MDNIITQDEFEKDVKIDNSSTWHLSECLKSHPKTEGKYHKKLSDAIKILDDLTFELEIITAEIAEEIIDKAEEDGRTIPASGKEFVLKVMIKKDERYQELRRGVIKAKYNVSVLL